MTVQATPAPARLDLPGHRSDRAELTVALAIIAVATLARILFLTTAHLELDFEEAQYWYWAQHPAWGYFSKPPLIAWLIGATTFLFGDGEAAVRLASPLLHGAAALAILGIGRRLGGARLGTWSALAYLTLPGTSISTALITTDPPLLFLWAGALYCLIRRRDGGGMIWSCGLGLALGLGLLAKYAMIYFVLCAIIYLLADGAARRRFALRDGLVVLAVAAICIAPNVAWNLSNGFVTLRHTADNADVHGIALDLREIGNFFGSQLGLMGPGLFILFVYALFTGRRQQGGPPDNRRLLLCFSLPIFLLILVEAVLSRAHANWAAPAFVAAVVLAVEVGLRIRWRWWLPTAVTFHAAIAVIICAALAAVPVLTLPSGKLVEIGSRFRGWSELGDKVAAALRENPGSVLLGDQRPLLAYLAYYARPTPDGVVEWNPPGGAIDDQFKLTTRLDADMRGPFVFLATYPSPPLLARFASVSPAQEIVIRPAPGIERRYWLYRLRDFRGY